MKKTPLMTNDKDEYSQDNEDAKENAENGSMNVLLTLHRLIQI